jgi:hypothetical protein
MPVRRARFSRGWVVLPLLAFLLAGCSVRRPSSGARFLAAGEGAQATQKEVRLLLFGTVHLGLQQLAGEDRARYLSEVVRQEGDPFAPRPAGSPEPFLVFLLSVENLSAETLLLSPGFATLSGQGGSPRESPLDPTLLGEALAADPAFTPELAARLAPDTLTIDSGRRHSRLLVFPPLPRRTKTAIVVIPLVGAGNLAVEASFPFRVSWPEI